MGLPDRVDGPRRELPFSPPDTGLPTWTVILLVVAAAFALYQTRQWLERDAVAETGKTSFPKPVREALPVITQMPKTAPGAPAWTSCKVDGRVLYSNTGCSLASRPLEVQPGGVGGGGLRSQATAAPVSVTLYHCKDYNGGTFWAGAHCNQHKALVDRMVDVPAGLPFNQQVQLAENNRSAAQQLLVDQMAQAQPVSAPVDSRKQVCAALEEQIAHWDAMARQPQSAQTQDWIRDKRKKARDQQFRLRC